MTRRDGRDGSGGSLRLAALVLVAGAIAGGGVLGTVPAHQGPQTALQPAALASEAAPTGSTSSSWYCPGGPAELAGTTHLLLANAAGRAVRVGLEVVDTQGTRRSESLRLAPHAESDVVPGRLVHGAWVASRVQVQGGAVSATELVDGRRGRSVATCASEVSSNWYFAAGSTAGGSTLSVTLFNPTPNLAVVDLSFVTASGFTAPAPFQGLVVKPGALRSLTVGAYVQNQGAVATVVDARSGAVVADVLQLYGPGGTAGVALALGAPTTSRRWDLPSVENSSQGASDLAVFNPSARAERVVVGVQLPTGPVEPFTQTLGPRSVWTLATSEQLRLATQEPYTVRVVASAPGVVVSRIGAGAPHGPDPWWAGDVSVSGLETATAHEWVVPAVAPAPPPVESTGASSAAPPMQSGMQADLSTLVVENPTRRAAAVDISWWSRSGRMHVRRITVAARGRTAVTAPGAPALLESSSPVAVMGDASPAGTAGVLGVPAVPLRRMSRSPTTTRR